MTSRSPSPHRRYAISFIFYTSIAFPSVLLLLLIIFFLYFYFSDHRCPTIPLRSSPSSSSIRHFSFRSLRSATINFDPSRFLGRGASACVFHGVLPDGKSVAVKRLDTVFLGREFLNELQLLSDLHHSPYIVSLVGYCLEGNRRVNGVLVYEYMCNGSLQDAMFGSCCQILGWDRRFGIILDVAQALAYLHLECDPPVIHGDVKPSNVLLGVDFKAKLADFGLSRRKPDMLNQKLSLCPQADLSISFPYSITCTNHEKKAGLKEKDNVMIYSNPTWGNDCCWKKDGSGELNRMDYLKERVGTNQIFPSMNPNWDDREKRSIHTKLFEQVNLSETLSKDVNGKIEDKNAEAHLNKKVRKTRQWWKEEFFAEIDKSNNARESYRIGRNLEPNSWKRRRKSKSVESDLSSKTSTRGTICYTAPEYRSYKPPLEKTDIYSFGVLILVIVSGRKPLQIDDSPLKLARPNLISWCRQSAILGDVIRIMDERVKDSCDQDQVRLCITLALLCLQRSPERRPDIGDIVKILKREMEIPDLPLESSKSPAYKKKKEVI